MLASVTPEAEDAPHIPVLLEEVCRALCPIRDSILIDGTFGAGGYSRAFLKKHAAQVIGIDRDPSALEMAEHWQAEYPALTLVQGVYSELDAIARDWAQGPVTAVVLDIGVSSMQLDQSARGFSFMRDGPLDMRMSSEGPSAADLINTADEAVLADIFYHYGEDRASRRIARAVIRERAKAPISSTLHLAGIVADVLPKPRPGQAHPATRVFQALRIAVNDELGELVRGLAAAEAVLSPGGRLVVVTFHSLEDRIVKRYLQMASATSTGGSRHGPSQSLADPRFERPAKPQEAGPAELDRNPRSRSARLRTAVRTSAAPKAMDAHALGMPKARMLDRHMGGAA